MKQDSHPQRKFSALVCRAALAAGMVLAGVGSAPVAQAKQAGASLEIAAPGQVGVGEPIEITLTVKQAADIAGYETTLLFDTAAAEFAGLRQRQNDLRKSGREVAPLTVVDLPAGVAFGLFSCPAADCLAGAGARRGKGAQGTVQLARVTLIANAPGTLEIRLDAAKFVNALGSPVEVALATPAITVQVGAAGEGRFYPAPAGMWALSPSTAPRSGRYNVTADRLVTYADAAEVALEWVLARQALAPCGSAVDVTRDINRDGCVDVADLQLVAGHFSLASTLPQTSAGTAGASLASVYTVNVISDGDDATIGNGVCATAFNVCTLRAAIQEANAHSGPDTINFNIMGSGVRTIQLKSKLPTLNDTSGPTTINGYTQPGAAPNTDPLVSNAVIMVEVAGNGEDRYDGFTITSPGNVIRGLAVYKLKRAFWIYGSVAGNNVLAGNFIGTNAAGTHGAPALVTGAHGVMIEQQAAGNRIGGTALADRNVISGNAQTGVAIWHENSNANLVYNNLIGLKPNGTGRLPNRKHGVDLNFGADTNVVGGTGSGQRNVLSGNDSSGVEVSHTSGTTENQVIGNFIGTEVTGQSAPGWSYNGYTGITLEDGVTNNIVADNVVGSNQQGGIQVTGTLTQGNQIYNNRVGISLTGAPIGNLLFGVRLDGNHNVFGPNNIVAYNQFNGLVIREADKDFNRITANSFSANGGLGIELLPNGVTPNDPGDADSGPNQNLNFPVLETAVPGQVTGTACAFCWVEVFIADGGAGVYGEGQAFAGAGSADGSGNFVVSINGVSSGSYVTATATDSTNNTSEFALNRLVQ